MEEASMIYAEFVTVDNVRVSVESERVVPIADLFWHPENFRYAAPDHDDFHTMGRFRAEHGGIERFCMEKYCNYGERLTGQ